MDTEEVSRGVQVASAQTTSAYWQWIVRCVSRIRVNTN